MNRTTTPRGHPPEIQSIITEKTRNYSERPLIKAAITHFLGQYRRGYFTLVGVPGSGKTSLLAHYAATNPHTIYYSAELEGKNQTEEFLITLCTQLIQNYSLPYAALPDNLTDGSWFLSRLLQNISEQLSHPLTIIIDGLDRIDYSKYPKSANLFYLPRYLPEGVYFLLSRRPFVEEKSKLLSEAPSLYFNLSQYATQNRQDLQTYLNHRLQDPNFPPSFAAPPLQQQLIENSAANFRYLSDILDAISQGFYSEPSQLGQLPPTLENYYHTHWQKMTEKGLSPLQLAILDSLLTNPEGRTLEDIAAQLEEDELNLQQIIDNWLEFLEQTQVNEEISYRFYHPTFREYLLNCTQGLS